jgi:AraC-like DNA-binding protein
MGCEVAFEDCLQINAPERPLRGHNTLISALRSWHSPHLHVLPMSIKFAMTGNINVETQNGLYRINNRRFLVVNAWEPYTFHIAPGSVAQTCSLFFRSHYLSSVQRGLTKSNAALLENADDPGCQYLEFPEALFPAQLKSVGARLRALFEAWQRGASQHCLSDRARDVGEALVHLRCSSLAQVSEIDALKRSTREELFRRAQLALIYVQENFADSIDINSVAKQACMAPHHLHRTFRAIYGITLHQRIVQLRLEEARRLLQETDLPIASICHRVGYSSVPSFTNLFKSCFGSSPSVLRSNGDRRRLG